MIATVVTIILWIVLSPVIFFSLSPSIQQTIDISTTNPSRILTCLLPSGSLMWFISIMGTFENVGEGLSFGNLNSPTRVYGHLSAFYVLLTTVGSYFLYAFLIWYLDNVWPFQHGV